MIGAALVIGCAGQGAFAADDEDEEKPLIDTQIMRHILQGLGWQRDETGIEYRERSPLVLPANKQLPKPEAAAKKTAGWPDDPDVKRAKQRRDAEKNRKAYTEGVDDRPLLPNEYARKGTVNDLPTILGGGKSAEEAEKPSTVYELGSKSLFGARPSATRTNTRPSPASRRARACSSRRADTARRRRPSRTASARRSGPRRRSTARSLQSRGRSAPTGAPVGSELAGSRAFSLGTCFRGDVDGTRHVRVTRDTLR